MSADDVFVRCLKCGRLFRAVTNSHLRSVHGMTTYEYLAMFPGTELTSEEAKREMGVTKVGNQNFTGREHTEEAKQAMGEAKLGNQYSLGHVHTEEAKQLMREAAMGNQNFLGHVHTEETKQAMRGAKLGNQYGRGNTFKHTEEAKQLIRGSMMGNQNALGTVRTGEVCKQMSDSHKELWRGPEYAEYMAEAQHRKPTEPELQLRSVLDKHFPNEWKYVGNNQFGVEGKYPDFINVNSKKQVIEVFGMCWHDPFLFPNRLTEEELIAHYENHGFGCLVFWEFDVYNEEEVVQRVREKFSCGGK